MHLLTVRLLLVIMAVQSASLAWIRPSIAFESSLQEEPREATILEDKPAPLVPVRQRDEAAEDRIDAAALFTAHQQAMATTTTPVQQRLVLASLAKSRDVESLTFVSS